MRTTISAKANYVLGAMYASAQPYEGKGIQVTNRSEALVRFIADHFHIENKVTQDPRGKNSFFFKTESRPDLRSALEEYGVLLPKEQRLFPYNVSRRDMRHFVRGFFDAKAHVDYWNEKGTKLTHRNYVAFMFNRPFLNTLNTVLRNEAGVKHSRPSGRLLRLEHQDSLKLAAYMYAREGPFLEEKKFLLRTDYIPASMDHPHKIRSRKKIAQAKLLLLQDMPADLVAEQIGYKDRGALVAMFKRQTGKTITEFRKEAKAHVAARNN